jgi:beta-glucosidase
MTDWFGGDSARAQMKAGNDLIMPGRPHERDDIQAALDSGDLSMAQLDRNAKNILQIIFQSPAFAGYAYSDTPDLKAHAQIARTAAAEGVVLLKNDHGTLPLPSSLKSIAAFGNTSYDFLSGGTGSGDVNEAYTVSLVQGFTNNNLLVDAELQQVYEQHLQAERAKQPKKRYFFELLPPLPELTPDLTLIQRKAKDSELAIITIGRNSGEFQDRKVAGDFDLTATEKQLISMVSTAFHAEGKKVVLILNIGNVVETASWREQVDAIVLPWQGGQEAGNAVTDVLTGKVNPSGKLPVSFPLHYKDVPSSTFFPGEALSDAVVMDAYLNMPRGKHSQMKHQDGIYVGYRYYDSFAVPVAYPFGYGLSYTSFSYGQPKLSSARFNGELKISIEVKNTGKVAGKEVVQLYLTAPATSMDKPKKELKAFAKTSVLAPEQSEIVQFSLTADQLASYSEQAGRWVADAGTYQVLVAASSADVRQTASFNLATALQLPAVKVRLQPTAALTEFKPPVR